MHYWTLQKLPRTKLRGNLILGDVLLPVNAQQYGAAFTSNRFTYLKWEAFDRQDYCSIDFSLFREIQLDGNNFYINLRVPRKWGDQAEDSEI